MSEKKQTRFEEWEVVECNDCERWWTNQCDGAKGDKRVCNSFLATRSVMIPQKIKKIENDVKLLRWISLWLTIVALIHSVRWLLM